MLSMMLCVYTALTIICGLTMITNAGPTCYISGYESRVDLKKFKDMYNGTCGSSRPCIEIKHNMYLSGGVGTLVHTTSGSSASKVGNLTFVLKNITSRECYMEIHSLACENGWNGKLRFGKTINDKNFTTIFDLFQNYNFIQKCNCYACNCANSCDSCATKDAPDFFCNCIFNGNSNAVRHTFTSTTESKSYTTTTSITTSMPTSMVFQPYTTSLPDTTLSTMSASPKTDYVSAAHQTEETGTNTTAIVGGLLAVVVVSIGVTVYVFIWRRQRNKKAPDYSDSCIANPSYGETHDDQKCAGLDNMGYEESDKEVHTYDMADETKPEVSGELDYSYANFGGQSNSQEQTMNLNKTDSHKLQSENNDYDLANASSPPNDYFVIEKSSPSNLTGACFISETGDNDANERAETMRNGTVSPGVDNYFLLEESDSATTATGSEQLSGVLGENYFLFEQQSVSETKNSEQDVYELAHSQSHMKNFGDRKTETRCPAQQYQDDDPYDHARIGHVRTNGFDDGVYDELKKQNVRYRDDDVDNDYDHC